MNRAFFVYLLYIQFGIHNLAFGIKNYLQPPPKDW
jgi:hypothetical protein